MSVTTGRLICDKSTHLIHHVFLQTRDQTRRSRRALYATDRAGTFVSVKQGLRPAKVHEKPRTATTSFQQSTAKVRLVWFFDPARHLP